MTQESSQLTEATKDWSEEDKAWLEKHVPDTLKTIAVRHGRQLYTIVMQAGAATFALTTLHANVRHPQLSQMIGTLTKLFDQFCQRAVKGANHNIEQFIECKADIERLASLQDSGAKLPGERVSAGGIILDS